MPKPSSPELADQLIERLNDCCKNEGACSTLRRLLDKRVEAPKGSFALPDEHGAVGLLHVLNELVGVDEKGHGLIAAVLTEESGFLTGFQRYDATEDTKPSTPKAKSNPPPSK
jgi:hypothetical protein